MRLYPGERDRETERQRDKETDRQADRENTLQQNNTKQRAKAFSQNLPPSSQVFIVSQLICLAKASGSLLFPFQMKSPQFHRRSPDTNDTDLFPTHYLQCIYLNGDTSGTVCGDAYCARAPKPVSMRHKPAFAAWGVRSFLPFFKEAKRLHAFLH